MNLLKRASYFEWKDLSGDGLYHFSIPKGENGVYDLYVRDSQGDSQVIGDGRFGTYFTTHLYGPYKSPIEYASTLEEAKALIKRRVLKYNEDAIKAKEIEMNRLKNLTNTIKEIPE